MNAAKTLVMVALVGGILVAGSSRGPAPDLPRSPDDNAGNYDAVIATAGKAVNDVPVPALGILGAAQCKKQDAKAASASYAKLRALSPADADFVRSACVVGGVPLPEAG